MGNIERRSIEEHLACASRLKLPKLCRRVAETFSLPKFELDYENETEWGLVEVDNIEYNVSIPYRDGTLQEWDSSVPTGCNVGITLSIYREHPHAGDRAWTEQFARAWAQKFTDAMGGQVAYHRSSSPSGKDVIRQEIFEPGS